MTFAENINRICAEKGTSLTSVIKQLKNGQSAYTTAINKRGSVPNQEELLKLAEILDCTVMDFFKDDVEEVLPSNEDERDILNIYRSLSRRKKHEFMSMVYEFENCDDDENIV